LRLLDLFASRKGTLAFLVKNATSRNVIELLPKKQYRVAHLRTLQIDAAREFDVAVDASIFVAELGAARTEQTCQVASFVQPRQVIREFGWVGDKFVSEVKKYQANARMDGESIFIWRQGLKHDCARIMELDVREEKLFNGEGEEVSIEAPYLYWLLKSSDLQVFEALPRKKVIVTQKKLGEDTSALRERAPYLWNYLVKHSSFLDQRRSSIYRDRPQFSIFGIGEYSFAPYKVAISGLYKEPNFSLVCPIAGRPVLVDDTCYMLAFDSYLDALITATLYNTDSVKQFLQSIIFNDAKRPFTKQVLMRVDSANVAVEVSLDSLYAYWKRIRYTPRVVVTEWDFENYKDRILNRSKKKNNLQLNLPV